MALIQKRTSPVEFAHLAEKSGKGSISNLSTKVCWGVRPGDHRPPAVVTFTALSASRAVTCGLREADAGVECWGRAYASPPPSGAFAGVAA